MKTVETISRAAAPRPGGRRIVVIGLVAAAVIAAGVYMRSRPAPEAGTAEAGRTAQLVTAITIRTKTFERTAPVAGEARPVNDVRVFAPTPGVRIAAVMAEIGDQVEKDQPLARLDTAVVDAQVSESEALLKQAQVEYSRARQDYERIEPIAETGALSIEEVANRRAAMDAAAARLAAQRAAYAQISARIQGGFVRAPEAGLIIERNARVGEYADQSSLFRIVGGNRLEVAAAVSETDLLSVKTGQTAVFKTTDGQEVEAKLRVAPVAVNSSTRVGEALFDLPADAPVRAGMYLRGEVVTERFEAPAAPKTSIIYSASGPAVYTLSDGVAQLTPVRLGIESGGDVAVLSGLEVGATIAGAGGAFLIDGDAVRTVAASGAD